MRAFKKFEIGKYPFPKDAKEAWILNHVGMQLKEKSIYKDEAIKHLITFIVFDTSLVEKFTIKNIVNECLQFLKSYKIVKSKNSNNCVYYDAGYKIVYK